MTEEGECCLSGGAQQYALFVFTLKTIASPCGSGIGEMRLQGTVTNDRRSTNACEALPLKTLMKVSGRPFVYFQNSHWSRPRRAPWDGRGRWGIRCMAPASACRAWVPRGSFGPGLPPPGEGRGKGRVCSKTERWVSGQVLLQSDRLETLSTPWLHRCGNPFRLPHECGEDVRPSW